MTDDVGRSYDGNSILAVRRVAYHIKRAEADLQYALVDLSISGDIVAQARLAAVLEDLSSLQRALPSYSPFQGKRKDGEPGWKFAYHQEESAA